MAAGKLSFTQTEFRIREDGTYIGAKVSVERTVGTTGIVSVKVTNSSASSLGRGTRKLDFFPINPITTTGSAQLLTWADGEDGIKTLEFTIIQENLVEGDEFVPLKLGSFKGAVAGAIPECNLIIVDDDGIQGIKGDKGDKGEPGEPGMPGEPGIGLPGQSLNFRGLWDVGNSYQPFDVVSFNGSSYVAIFENMGITPGDNPLTGPNIFWKLIAAKGDKGDKGIQGIQGIQGLAGAMPVFGEWVNIPLTTGISISGGDLKVRRAGSFIHIQGGVQITISGVNSAVVGANIGTIPDGFNVTPYKEFPISVNAAAGNTLAVGICRYGINNSITVLPSPTYLNQNCYYSIDQVLID